MSQLTLAILPLGKLVHNLLNLRLDFLRRVRVESFPNERLIWDALNDIEVCDRALLCQRTNAVFIRREPVRNVT